MTDQSTDPVSLCPDVEGRLIRILAGFERLYERRGDPIGRYDPKRYDQAMTKKPSMRQRARVYLTAHPKADNDEVTEATGATDRSASDARRDLGLPAPRGGRAPLLRQSIIALRRRNPELPTWLISRRTGASLRYTQRVLSDLKRARGDGACE